MNSKRSAVLSALVLMFALGLMMFASQTRAATNRYVSNTGTDAGDCSSSSPCQTTSYAISHSNPGYTINVAAGTYNEQVAISKTLTLLGAKANVDARTRIASGESIINNACGPVQIEADNVVLNGFTVQGSTMSDPCFIAGIWTNPGFSGTHGGHQILYNIVQNNVAGIELDNDGTFQTKVQFNLIQNNNNPGPNAGTGIEVNFGLDKALIDSNKFVGNALESAIDLFTASNVTVSKNEFDSNRRAIGMGGDSSLTISNNKIHNSTGATTADLRLFGGVSGVSISCNTLANGPGRAIRMDDECGGTCPNSSITINNNNISGYPIAGLEVDSGGYAGGPLDATNNWWGSSTGPTIASNPGGTGEIIIDPDGVVTYFPFLTTFNSCAPVPQIGPPTNKDQCKDGGWQSFNTPRKFKNQGDCIQFVNTGK